MLNHPVMSDSLWTAVYQASLSLTISQSLPKFMFIALEMDGHPSISSSDLVPKVARSQCLETVLVYMTKESLQVWLKLLES